GADVIHVDAATRFRDQILMHGLYLADGRGRIFLQPPPGGDGDAERRVAVREGGGGRGDPRHRAAQMLDDRVKIRVLYAQGVLGNDVKRGIRQSAQKVGAPIVAESRGERADVGLMNGGVGARREVVDRRRGISAQGCKYALRLMRRSGMEGGDEYIGRPAALMTNAEMRGRGVGQARREVAVEVQ